MLASSPFLLAPGRLCLSSMCVHAKAKTRNQQTSDGKKDGKSIWKRPIANKHDRHGKHSRKVSKWVKGQTSKQVNKRGCLRGKNVGLDRVSIASLCWSMDDTLASKTYAWKCKQSCKDAKKADWWHKQAWLAHHRMERKRGKICTKQLASWWCIPNGYIQTRPRGCQM